MPEPWTQTRLLAELAALGIAHEMVEHPPVATVEAAHAYWDDLPGLAVKNLLLKDAGKRLWLVVAPAEDPVDLKSLRPRIGAKRLSFANAADLMASLGVEPGAVTPLAVVNDRDHQVTVVLDSTLATEAHILVHPLVNTATLILSGADTIRFLTHHCHPPLVLGLAA